MNHPNKSIKTSDKWKTRKRPRPMWTNGPSRHYSIISFVILSNLMSILDSFTNSVIEESHRISFYDKLIPSAEAVAASPHPFREELQDGTLSPPLYIHGNHLYSYLTDESGFTVIHDDNLGYTVYATRHEETGEMVKTSLVVGKDDPFNATVNGILRGPHEFPSEEIRSCWENCGKFCIDTQEWKRRFPHLYDDSQTQGDLKTTSNTKNDPPLHRNLRRRKNKNNEIKDLNQQDYDEIPTGRIINEQTSLFENSKRTGDFSRGILHNLVVLIRFSDHASRKLPSKEQIDILMNKSGGHPIFAPSGSVKDFFSSNSYNNFAVVSTVMDWITLPLPEAYYADNSSGSTEKFESALRESLDRLDITPNFSFADFDQNRDGLVDAIMFLHSGYGAEWGKTDCYGQHKIDRIWAHKWNIEPAWISKQGYQVSRYHTSSSLWGTCGTDIARIGTISHELGHVMGLPDLYSGGSGIGSFGIMGNSWGFDGTQYYPPSFSAWSKLKLGWAEAKDITVDGLYYVKASQQYPDIYKLSLGYPNGEYILIENRQTIGFDSKMPQGGIVMWHIDEIESCVNVPGYPGQIDWPHNGYHYRVAIIQPDGMYELEKGDNRGNFGDVWHANGISQRIGPSINTQFGPYPNTDSYQGGTITQTGHIISDFSKSDMTMTFKVTLGSLVAASIPQALPTIQPTPPPTPVPILIGTKSEIETSVTGDTGSCGNFFDVLNTSPHTITITSIDIHTRSKGRNLEIEVYTKVGSHIGYEQNSSFWRKIASTTITGLGYLNLTPIPEQDFNNVNINSGQTQAFYVTFKQPDIRYTKRDTNDFGETSALNSDLEIFIGSGVGSYPFGNLYQSREWNGKIHYVKNDQRRSPVSDQKTFKLKTTFAQNNGSYGSMFNVVAFRSLAISSMDIHTRDTSNIKVEIYSKTGSYIGHEKSPNSWTKIVDTTLTGRGIGWPTTIPSGIFPLTEIPEGETRAFYVTLDSADLRYTTGKVESANSDIAVSDSVGVGGYPFGPIYSPRMWNGSLRYHFIKDDASSSGSYLTNDSQSPQEIVTTFLNGNGSYGIQFDIIALKRIRVLTFDIHTRSTNDITVEVYTKKGTHEKYQQDSNEWSRICQTSVRGQGLGNRTPLPSASMSSVQIMENERQAFYITLYTPDLRYSNGDLFETITASNDHLQILDGSGIGGYPFKKAYPERLFNGVVKYVEISNDDKELPTTMKGGNGSYGCIFHVKSSEKIQIISLSTNVIATGIINIEVWTSSGPFAESKRSLTEWTKVADAVLFGNGNGIQTEISESEFQPVDVEANQIQIFYVTLKKAELRYTNGDTKFSDGVLEIFDGIGVGSYPLDSAPLYKDRMFNGKIKYR